MATKITCDVLESYVHCTYKAHLKLAGAQGRPSDYEILQGEARNRVRRAAAARLAGRYKDGEILRDIVITLPLLKQGVPLLLDATVEAHALSIRFDALQKEAGASRLGDFHYIPVVFHETERFRRQHTELLGVGDMPVGGGRLQEFLGRDAADVQAGATDLVVLDHPYVQAGGCAVEGGGIAARTATDDHDVVVFLGHRATLGAFGTIS